MSTTPRPPIASAAEWRALRLSLLIREKAARRDLDQLAAERRRLPMVRVEKDYRFEGPAGRVPFVDLFEGRAQLVVYHFMFAPDWEKGCPGCTGFVNALGDLSLLAERDTTFVLISRAPFAKLDAYRRRHGWSRAWFSSFGEDFNRDFQVTLDPAAGQSEYNYQPVSHTGESHGLSVFFREGADVFHTYSTYARGVEHLTDAYALLDVTPYGRQEDWVDSPDSWPQKPTYG